MNVRVKPASSRFLRWSLVLGGVLTLGAACIGGAKNPVKSANGALAPGAGARGGKGEEGAFRVVFAGPEGEANEVSELSLVFSRPLRKLELAGAPPPAIAISPAIAGRWLWVGTHAVHFVPETPHLPGSTRYTVTVPADLRALDGSTLGSPYQLEFSTPRLKLVDSEPGSGSRGLEPNTKFTLHFNQAVDPEKLRALSKLSATRAGKTEALAFTVTRPDPNQPKRIELKPTRPLPIHSEIKLSVAESLTGLEGPLPLAAAFEIPVETYGPLAVDSLNCDRETPHGQCAPGGSWSLEMSNAVPLKDLKRALSITPAVPLRFENWTDETTPVSYLSINGSFRAGTKYTLRVAADVRDVHGQSLGRVFSKEMAIDDYFPAVEIGVQGHVLDPRTASAVPVGSLNVKSYGLSTAALTPQDALLLSNEDEPDKRWQVFRGLKQTVVRSISPGAGLNRVSKENLPLATLLGTSGHGPLAIGVEYERNPKDYRSLETFKIVQLTDLAITGKLSPDGSLVWVTRVSSAEPVAQATVRILGGESGERRYQTDAQGIAKIPAQDFRPKLDESSGDAAAILVVQSGEDWAYERARDFLSPWRFSVPFDWSGRKRNYGMIFTERGIYRPGDDVQVKGIVRREQASGNATPAGEELTLELYSPDSERTHSQTVKLNQFGTFAARLKVPETGHLGAWQIKAQLAEDTIYESFDVSEYRPAEFKVAVESDRPSYVRGDTAHWIGRGDYLFGAPMAKASGRYTVSRAPSYFEVPNSEGFSTSAAAFHADLEEQGLTTSQLVAQSGNLDEHGALSFSQKLELPAQRGPELLSAELEVSDVSRQSIAGSTSAIVHPAEFYLALKEPEDYFAAAPGKFATSVLALSPKGERLSGKSVKVELISRRWTYARQKQGDNDSQLVSKVVDRVVGTCAVTTAQTPVPCSLELKEAGYHVLHATAKDARGNGAESALSVYGIGEQGTSFADSDRLSVELKSNKPTYQVGETARVLIKSPFAEADALVTIERAGVYRSQRLRLHGPTPTIDVPISDDLRPNAFVAVHLLRARKVGEKPSLGAPFRVGYTELRVDPEARRLAVTVHPNQADFSPGAEVSVELVVKDRAGKPQASEVTVYAVDEGVLSLIGYKVPDPIPVFTAPRRLSVATLEARDGLARIGLEALDGALGGDKGRDGGGGGLSPARRDFRQTAYFNPSVLTDATGKARVRFKLPESLTTYRVMAVAVGDGDQYGFGAASVTTSKRLMARPALPRFLRAGDSLEAGVVISAKNFEPGQVTVQARATGITLAGNGSRTISLARDQSLEVRFPFRAETAGQANFRFDVSAGAEKDAVVVDRRIDSPATLEAVALYGKSQDSVAEALGDMTTIRPDVGQLDLSVASTALVGLGAGVDQLVQYPYGCTEQLSSRLIPLVPLRDLAKDFKIPLPLDLNQVVPRTVAEIVSRQRGDGGFGLWPNSTESYPWVGAYALFVLSQAKLHGTAVPQNVFDRGKDYLRRYLAETAEDQYRLPTTAFVLDVLADMGAADVGYQQKLFERRKQLPLFAKALLLHAIGVSKGQKKLSDALLPELTNALRIENDAAFVGENTGDEYAVLMDSEARTSALVLRALLSVKPDHPLAAELARGLLRQRVDGSWRSTQETAYALLALDAYRRAQEKAVPDFQVKALLGEQAVMEAEFHERSLSAQQSRVAIGKVAGAKSASLVFEKRGSGTLFYQARLRYARRTLPTDTLDQGFFVQKGLRPVSPEGLPQALSSIADTVAPRFRGGDLVVADLVIVTPSPRDFVVVDDPLPAGFEAVDSHLSTTSGALAVGESNDYGSCADCDYETARDDLAAGHTFFENYSQRELRDDRVLFFADHMAAGMYHYRYLARATTLGKFVLPSTRVEEMYTPETFGRNGATLVSVE
ncbi:MAG TPA: MG2 domain-containing protein [Polyangiaceae bacterium]|nr:MG2 domain-containing protein [Polyangiaceae bacterium]